MEHFRHEHYRVILRLKRKKRKKETLYKLVKNYNARVKKPLNYDSVRIGLLNFID